ncbi:MAG: DUF5615 family PIN-like protein [Chitinophagaceae bacterium]
MMELSDFSYLADENISNHLVEFLRVQNSNLISVREQGLHGTSDEALVQLAEEKDLVILTHDSDFGKIIFTNRGIKTGVIFLRPGHIDPQYHIQTMQRLFSTSLELTFPFMLVVQRTGEDLKIRKRIV